MKRNYQNKSKGIGKAKHPQRQRRVNDNHVARIQASLVKEKEQNKNLRRLIEGMDSCNENLKQELKILQGENGKLETNQNKLAEDVNRLLEENESTNQKVSNLEDQIGALMKANQSLSDKNEANERELKRKFRREVAALNEELRISREGNSELVRRLKNQKAEASERFCASSEMIQKLKELLKKEEEKQKEVLMRNVNLINRMNEMGKELRAKEEELKRIQRFNSLFSNDS